MGFSERIDTILNWTEVFLQKTKLIIEVVYGARNALLLYKSYYFSSLIIIRSTPSLRSFPNVAFETIPMFVRLTHMDFVERNDIILNWTDVIR